MKQEYERIRLTITPFDEEDVITTSEIDRNNAYHDMSDLIANDKTGRSVPPGPWY